MEGESFLYRDCWYPRAVISPAPAKAQRGLGEEQNWGGDILPPCDDAVDWTRLSCFLSEGLEGMSIFYLPRGNEYLSFTSSE
jgi:hypothetical protein